MAFFEGLGVPLKTERGNRVFPVSDQATDIVDALVGFAKDGGAKIFTGQAAKEVLAENGQVTGVLLESGEAIPCARAVIATGGKSYPLTGSTGDGYRMAQLLGHTIAPIKPSMIPIVAKEGYCAAMMGLSLRNVTLKVLDSGKKKPVFEELGEMLFTHFGVSGPLVLSGIQPHDRGPLPLPDGDRPEAGPHRPAAGCTAAAGTLRKTATGTSPTPWMPSCPGR